MKKALRTWENLKLLYDQTTRGEIDPVILAQDIYESNINSYQTPYDDEADVTWQGITQ